MPRRHRPPAPARHFETKGEHKFNAITYRRWGYMANVGLSLLGIYWIERTRSGRSVLDWTAHRFASTEKGLERMRYYITKTFFLTGRLPCHPADEMARGPQGRAGP
ncbi:MAG: hypothetical protein WDN72_05630 [Alphaproteobacteria bacterium]